MAIRRIIVNDRFQLGYEYELTEREGQSFDPDFEPELSPAEMLELGVFGGLYLTDCQDEFPPTWFVNAALSPGKRDPSINFFGVDASQPLAEWRKNGWIHEQDPRGWFQWYCRYYLGRRSADDVRQIGRWRAMRRHIAQISKNCDRFDFSCRPKQRQALLHWAYDSRNL